MKVEHESIKVSQPNRGTVVLLTISKREQPLKQLALNPKNNMPTSGCLIEVCDVVLGGNRTPYLYCQTVF